VRRHLISGFIVPLALALLTSLVVFRIVSTHERDLTHVNETSRTSAQLNALIKTVIDAETGQRGFVITGDEVFLEPYLSSTVEFGVTLLALRGLLTDSASQETLSEIDALFEQWHREVADVVVQARRQAPVELGSALRGASTAFTEARAATMRYQLMNESSLLNRSGLLLGEVERQLERALSLGISGLRRTEVRAAAAQVARYRREDGSGRAPPERAQTLGDALARLATDAETAETEVTTLIRAGAGKRLTDAIRTRVADLSSEVNTTLERTLAASTAATQRTQWVAFFGPLFAALVSLLAILQGLRRVNRSVRKLAVVAKEIAAGQLERRLTLAEDDELRPLAEDFNRMADRLSERERQNTQLEEFSSTLQVCTTTKDAFEVVERFGPQLFGALSGTLYLINSSRNLLETVSSWGEGRLAGAETPLVHIPTDCWAVRLSRPLRVDGTEKGIVCLHAPTPVPAKSLCVPLRSQDETLGLLYLFAHEPGATLTGATEQFAVTVAEQLALALSNLRLRESLRQQSIHDPLTGLYNRRHLEETLELELHRAARRNEALSVVMFDVDHFKRYNDLHGHDAGDTVLRALSDLVKRHIRAGDLAYRYGGEEFLLVQPGMGVADALKRAESLREAAANLMLAERGSPLGSVTISLGIASYPTHAQTGADLIKRADEALYHAKRGGRNRTVPTGSEPQPVEG